MKKIIKCAHCRRKIGLNYCHLKSDASNCEEYYCSLWCAVNEHSIDRVRWAKCKECGKFVNVDAVIDKSGSLYCSFECALMANGVEIIKKPIQKCCICGADDSKKYFKKNEALYCSGCAGKIILKKLEDDPDHEIANQTIAQALKTLGFEEIEEDEKE